MVSRMERYDSSKDDVKITKRSDRNKSLYDQVSISEMNPEYIDINTTNVFEINSLNDSIKKRSSYQKLRTLDDVFEKEKTSSKEEDTPIQKEERIYNIDEILKKAKEEHHQEDKKRLLNTEYNILTKLDLEKVKNNTGFNKDHYKKIIDDIYEEQESYDDGKDLFDDLIDKNEPKEEKKKEQETKETEDNKEEIKDVKDDTSKLVTKIEVTKEMKLNEDEDLEEDNEKRNPLLTIIIILVVLLLLAAGYLIVKYFDII